MKPYLLSLCNRIKLLKVINMHMPNPQKNHSRPFTRKSLLAPNMLVPNPMLCLNGSAQ